MTRIPGDYTKELIYVLLAFGVVARLLAASLGFTYDMESYEQVGRLVASGANVYESTTRYNYGPVWFLVLGVLYKFSSFFPDPFAVLRFSIPFLLSFVDLGIFFFLRRFFGPAAAFIFYLNPLAIILTGYGSHFDNLAILAALIAAYVYGKHGKRHTFRGKMAAFALLGLSLVVKHVFVAFPLWLAVREREWKYRLLALFVPFGIFGLSFLPFVRSGLAGIIDNVFLYVSFKNAPLWHFFVLHGFPRIANEYVVFGVALLVGAVAFRKKPIVEALLLYTMTLVIFSVAIADQYFSIVLPFIAVFPNVFFFLFTLLQMLYMWVVVSGGEVYASFLGRMLDRPAIGYDWQLALLFMGLAYALTGKRMQQWRAKHWIRFLVVSNVLFVFAILTPNYLENKKVTAIEQAIQRGDYEEANTFYSRIEKEAPLAGSRFWNKLTRSRFYIEHYREGVKEVLESKE